MRNTIFISVCRSVWFRSLCNGQKFIYTLMKLTQSAHCEPLDNNVSLKKASTLWNFRCSRINFLPISGYELKFKN